MNMHMHYFICPRRDPAPVPGKNVALRREAVDLLDREKRPGESYSDVVLRLAKGRSPLLDLVESLRRLPPVKDHDLDRRIRALRRKERSRPPRRADL